MAGLIQHRSAPNPLPRQPQVFLEHLLSALPIRRPSGKKPNSRGVHLPLGPAASLSVTCLGPAHVSLHTPGVLPTPAGQRGSQPSGPKLTASRPERAVGPSLAWTCLRGHTEHTRSHPLAHTHRLAHVHPAPEPGHRSDPARALRPTWFWFQVPRESLGRMGSLRAGGSTRHSQSWPCCPAPSGPQTL